MASSAHTPDKVAQSFLKQYYHMLSTKPDELPRFYNEHSSFTHSSGHHVESSVRGQAQIREKVASLNLAGSSVDLSNGSVDAQSSSDDAVFLTVTGTFAAPGDAARPFVQSFFLAAQHTGPQNVRSYFVMNSVFRLLSVDLPVVEEHAEKARPQQVEADKGAGSVPRAQEAASAPVVEAVAPVQHAPVQEEEPVVEEEEEVVEPVPAAAPAPAAESQPKSFLDALKKHLPSETSASAPAPARAPKTQRVHQPKETKSESKETQAVVAHAIWVSSVSDDATSAELTAVFGKFGTITKVDLLAGRGYAFVEFETPASVQAVLTSGEEFTLGGKQLKVEPKSSGKGATARKAGAAKTARGPSPKNSERREKPKDGAAAPRREGKRGPDRKERPAARPATEAAAKK